MNYNQSTGRWLFAPYEVIRVKECLAQLINDNRVHDTERNFLSDMTTKFNRHQPCLSTAQLAWFNRILIRCGHPDFN